MKENTDMASFDSYVEGTGAFDETSSETTNEVAIQDDAK